MKKNVEIMIDEKVNSHLSLQESAKEFFRELDSELNTTPGGANIEDVIINFENVVFISQSFAHEYIKQKNKTCKNIIEKRVPKKVKAIFEIVSKHAD